MLEALAVIIVLGIALFITLPHLTQSKAGNEFAAAKAKAIQLNLAKDAYISFVGMDTAISAWNSPAITTEGRYSLIKNYLPTISSSATFQAYTAVSGYEFSFSDTITQPVLIRETGSTSWLAY